MTEATSHLFAGHTRRNLSLAAALALVFALLPLAGTAHTGHVDYSTFESPSNDTVVNHATGESAPPEGAAEAVSEQDGQIPTQRFNGSDRHGTAQQIAQYDSANLGPNHGSDTVLLARSNLFPDALAGNYLAGQTDASLLLTATDTYVDNTRQALANLSENQGVSNVTILGSTQAISEDVAQQIEDDGFNVDRIGGAGRYETAAEILEAGDNIGSFQGNSTAIVANGNDFPDALVSGALSYEGEFPILLTEQDNLVDTTEQALQDNGIEQVIIPGGPAAVSDQVESELESVTGNDAIRRAGDTRVTTAISIAEFAENNFAFDRSEVNFARGGSTDDNPAFADALTIGPHAGLETSILLLTQSESSLDGPDNPVAGFLGETACDRGLVHLSGGFAAIQESVEGEIRDAATAEDSPCQITLTPQSATNQVGQTHTVTTTVTDNGGSAIADQSVTVTAEGDETAQPTPDSGQGSTNDDGEFQFSFTSQSPGDVEITATTENADGNDITATATKTFETADVGESGGPGEDGSLTLSPQEDTNTVGNPHSVTATVQTAEDDPAQADVLFEVSDDGNPEPPEGTESTGDDGEATFEFTNDTATTNSILACTNPDGSEPDSCDDTSDNLTDDASKAFVEADLESATVTTTDEGEFFDQFGDQDGDNDALALIFSGAVSGVSDATRIEFSGDAEAIECGTTGVTCQVDGDTLTLSTPGLSNPRDLGGKSVTNVENLNDGAGNSATVSNPVEMDFWFTSPDKNDNNPDSRVEFNGNEAQIGDGSVLLEITDEGGGGQSRAEIGTSQFGTVEADGYPTVGCGGSNERSCRSGLQIRDITQLSYSVLVNDDVAPYLQLEITSDAEDGDSESDYGVLQYDPETTTTSGFQTYNPTDSNAPKAWDLDEGDDDSVNQGECVDCSFQEVLDTLKGDDAGVRFTVNFTLGRAPGNTGIDQVYIDAFTVGIDGQGSRTFDFEPTGVE